MPDEINSADVLAQSPLATPSQAATLGQQPAVQPPYQGDATADMLEANGATPAQPKRSALKTMLLNFAEGMGKSLQYQAGVPQYDQTQAETAKLKAQQPYIAPQAEATITGQTLDNQLKQRQVDAVSNIGDSSSITGSLGTLSPDEQAIMSAATQQFKLGNLGALTSGVQHITAMRAITGRQTRSDTIVTPELAQQYPALAPFLGKPINPSQIAAISRGEAINNVFSNTAAGPIVVSKSGPNAGKATPVTLNGKNIPSTQEAGAYWQAKYGVVKTVDGDGNPQYESRLNAPGSATDNNAFQVFKGKAGLDNFKDALTRIDTNLDVLKDTNQRALVAQTLRNIGSQHDPGIITALVGSAVATGLDPKAADLVAATLNAREWIGANRSFAGNFQGSEALYQRMVGNIAGPMNSPEVNRALIKQDMNNTTKIEDRILKFQGGSKAAPPTSNSGGFDWSKIKGAVPVNK